MSIIVGQHGSLLFTSSQQNALSLHRRRTGKDAGREHDDHKSVEFVSIHSTMVFLSNPEEMLIGVCYFLIDGISGKLL